LYSSEEAKASNEESGPYEKQDRERYLSNYERASETAMTSGFTAPATLLEGLIERVGGGGECRREAKEDGARYRS
jgi:hypothetical protein